MEWPHLAYSCIRIEGIVAIPTCAEALEGRLTHHVSQHGPDGHKIGPFRYGEQSLVPYIIVPIIIQVKHKEAYVLRVYPW